MEKSTGLDSIKLFGQTYNAVHGADGCQYHALIGQYVDAHNEIQQVYTYVRNYDTFSTFWDHRFFDAIERGAYLLEQERDITMRCQIETLIPLIADRRDVADKFGADYTEVNGLFVTNSLHLFRIHSRVDGFVVCSNGVYGVCPHPLSVGYTYLNTLLSDIWDKKYTTRKHS